MRLVDIPSDEVETAVRDLPDDLRPRARHVITEQARVWSFADALETQGILSPPATSCGRPTSPCATTSKSRVQRSTRWWSMAWQAPASWVRA